MLRVLLVLFILVPATEIFVLFSMGRLIGGWETFALILVSGFLGAYLAKREARRVWDYAQHRLSRGEIPTDSILDGICIFAGGLLLVTPGFVTDLAGLFLVLPFTRPVAKLLLLWIIRRMIGRGNVNFYWRR
ncbi:FxsA family protein [Gorillibacterium sp. sgz5001074]|uniref:FxsA family protein n=1 Tax=Gorillibacterium sp. sgz5001074 TaxID=3446695 RepID=UPI003F67EF7C